MLLSKFWNTTSSIDVLISAGEALSVLDYVYIATYLTPAKTASRAYKVLKTPSLDSFTAGFAMSAASTGQVVKVRIMGIVPGFSSMTQGALRYASSTAGSLTETYEYGASLAGIAISSTELLVNTMNEQTAIPWMATRGFFLSGNGSPTVATSDKVTFSTDITAANTVSNPPTATLQAAGLTGNIGGYTMGGYTTAICLLANKTTYSTEITTAATTANLTAVRGASAGLSDRISGYVCGGITNQATAADTDLTDKVTFSNDTTAAQASANLSNVRGFSSGLGGGDTKGYVLGGGTNNTTVVVNTTDKLTYSTDVMAASTSTDLPTQSMHGSTNQGFTKGYFLGGLTGAAYTAAAYKITYSSDAIAAVTTANLTVATYSPFGMGDGGDNKGYSAGGFTGALVRVITATKTTFSTDTTTAQTSANLTYVRGQGTSFTD